jgi:hypothetical protein
MRILIHCFAPNSQINPSRFSFSYQDWQVTIDNWMTREQKCLKLVICKILSEAEIDHFRVNSDEEKRGEEYFHNRSRPYQEILVECAHLVEGLFSIFFHAGPPKFDTSRPITNLLADDEEEQLLLEGETITRGFGFLGRMEQGPFNMDNSITDVINKASLHIPALSFFAQATRSHLDNDNEVAFFLFFRILDGYFSDGSKDILKMLIKNKVDLEKYIPATQGLKRSLKTILIEMGISHKCENDYEGVLSDIVMIRHKLTHFSSTKAKHHHSPKIKLDLSNVNSQLYKACFCLLRDKINEL